jgi:hypothetical protein
MVLNKTPVKIPFWEGESYANLTYKFIPRFLWKDKPTENMGQIFGHRYEILNWDNDHTSMNTPILAEAYMNFGILFVFILFIILGLLLANFLLTQNLLINKFENVENLFGKLNIAISAVFFTQWESNLSMLLGKLIILFVTSRIVVWLYFRKQLF